MPEDLRQPHEIVAVVSQELVGHRVAQQVRVELHPDQGAVLVAHGSDPPLRQRSPFTDEDPLAFLSWSSLQVHLEGTAGRKGQRDGSLFVALAEPEDDGAAALTEDQVRQFKAGQVADPAAGVQEQVEDSVCSDVLPKFNFTQQPADLAAVQPLRCKLDPPKLLDQQGGVGGDVTLFCQPPQIPAHRYQGTVDGRHGLASFPPQVVPGVGQRLREEAVWIVLFAPAQDGWRGKIGGDAVSGCHGDNLDLEQKNTYEPSPGLRPIRGASGKWSKAQVVRARRFYCWATKPFSLVHPNELRGRHEALFVRRFQNKLDRLTRSGLT